MRSIFLTLAFVSASATSTNFADESTPANSEANLPIKKVVLLSTGVGFFQHAGTITNDAEVELTFGVDDINDLLKSMVLQDLDGGQISAINYAPQDPNGSRLQSFDIDLSDAPTLPMLLGRLRGEQVEISGIDNVNGIVIGVEQKQVVNENGITTTKEYLNLLAETGLQQISLSAVRRVKLANEKLDKELRQALSFLASSRGADKRKVAIRFAGNGERRVRIGYVRETPTWKTSYRLVLNEQDKALLQGWAIVENTGQSDWQNVQLSLVSGNPVSFVMNLYEPLYIERPGVSVAMFESIKPGTHRLARRRPERGMGGGMMGGMMGGMGGGGFGGGGGTFGGPPTTTSVDPTVDAPLGDEGVAAAATADSVGQLFEYKIDAPVSLTRMSSAMLPIINERIECERICLFNAKSHKSHPLDAVRLKNISQVHVTRGPITVFDENTYAGDALTMDIPPGSERIVSYSLNSGIEINSTKKQRSSKLRSVRLDGDTLVFASGMNRTDAFMIRNDTTTSKTVVVELPIEKDWKVISDTKPTETTTKHYRFSKNIEPKQGGQVFVERERITEKRVALDRVTDKVLTGIEAIPDIDPKLKSLLDRLVDIQTNLNDLNAKVASIREQQRSITNEQTRIRSNMKSLDKETQLFERYVKQLTQQEDTLDELRKHLLELRANQRSLHSELDKLLGPFRQSKNDAVPSKKQKSANAAANSPFPIDDPGVDNEDDLDTSFDAPQSGGVF